MNKLTPPLIEMVLKRLDRTWPTEWDPDAREEFARAAKTMYGDLAAVMAALEFATREREWRPTIASFEADLARARRDQVRADTPPIVHRNPTSLDREAAAFFLPRLKGILAGIGSGPQEGVQARCDGFVDEWHRLHPNQSESF